MYHRHTSVRDEGFTVVEALVSFFMLALLTLAVGALLANSAQLRTSTNRSELAAAHIAKVLQRSQQTPFTALGYYTSDAGAPSGQVSLPLWRTPEGAVTSDPAKCTVEPCPTRIVEDAVVLGPFRPADSEPFYPPTEVVDIKGMPVRIDTWVTDSAHGTRRLTVQAEWPAGDGTCAEGTCLVQSFTRAATSNERAPSGEVLAQGCKSETLTICAAFVQSGRVLEGGSFIAEGSTARQDAPVLLEVSTSKPVSAVSATWTYDEGTPGAQVITISDFQQRSDGSPRWFAVIPADDVDVAVGRVKGVVRPGSVNVTFTASDGANNASAQVLAQWTYTSPSAPTVQVVGEVPTCAAGDSGLTLRLRVNQLSFGFADEFASDGSKDTVQVTFTVNTPSGKRTQTVNATFVPGSAVQTYQRSSGKVLGGHVRADFDAPIPTFANCEDITPQGVVTVTRAGEGTPALFYRQVIGE